MHLAGLIAKTNSSCDSCSVSTVPREIRQYRLVVAGKHRLGFRDDWLADHGYASQAHNMAASRRPHAAVGPPATGARIATHWRHPCKVLCHPRAVEEPAGVDKEKKQNKNGIANLLSTDFWTPDGLQDLCCTPSPPTPTTSCSSPAREDPTVRVRGGMGVGGRGRSSPL